MSAVIVVGSGIAGLTTALDLAATHEVTVVTKAAVGESNTRYAQGGIAAALFDDDSVDAHILDTLRAGAGLCVYDAVETLCAEGPDSIRRLLDLGVAFDLDGASLARGLEAAHSHARVLHAGGDATGAAIESTLIARAREAGVVLLENAFLADLVRDGDAVVGTRLLIDGTLHQLGADAVVLASGGAGRLYAHTTNPSVATGDGVAAAWRAGAEIIDPEFYQFHPTSLSVEGNFLISEAVRGAGAVLLDEGGNRFMRGVHPDAELGPRDVVARGIAAQMELQGGRPVLLDARGVADLVDRFPTINEATRAAGFDWAKEPIPVTPAAHYWMGGIASDRDGRTSLPGLYAVGEVACTGVHGANRLASNSLLEGLVFGARAARDILAGNAPAAAIRWWETPSGAMQTSSAGVDRVVRSEYPSGGTVVERARLQQLMWNAAGLRRDADTLHRAATQLAAMRPADTAFASTGGDSARFDRSALEDANLLLLARLIANGALAREESRGAHYRSDFPNTMATAAHSSWSREGALAC